jgi:putative DNA primase/helicase
MQATADIRIQTPHQHVTQVIDRSYSKTQLGKAAGLRDVHAIICRESRRYKGRVLVVVQQEIEEALPGIGPLPRNVELAHHNAVKGKDHWGPAPDRNGVEALIVVGRTAPSPIEVEKKAEALTGVAIERHQGWYPKASTAREMADGTFSGQPRPIGTLTPLLRPSAGISPRGRSYRSSAAHEASTEPQTTRWTSSS